MEQFFKFFKKNLKTERLELRILEPTLENAKLVWNVLKKQNKQDFQYAPMANNILPESLEETFNMMKLQEE